MAKQQILNSLGADSEDIFTYLPYLLQDLYALGSFPEKVIELLRRNSIPFKNAIELGCGKGAVSIALAKHLHINVTGIDGIPEFIKEAKIQAARRQVDSLCNFHTDDISAAINNISGYDLVIWASVGNIWGNLDQTLQNLKQCLVTPGFILFDDGYLTTPQINKSGVMTKEETYQQITASGLEIIDEMLLDTEHLQRANTINLSYISVRANELAKKYPEKQEMFAEYVKAQADESLFYNHFFQSVIWLLKKGK